MNGLNNNDLNMVDLDRRNDRPVKRKTSGNSKSKTGSARRSTGSSRRITDEYGHGRIPERRRSADELMHGAIPPSKKKKRKGKRGKAYRREKRRWQRFWKILAIYAGVLLILSILFLIYTDSCLKKYEKSQSSYAMENYLKKFGEAIDSGTIPEGMSFATSVSEFDSADIMSSSYLSYLQGKTLTYDKAPDSYMTEAPVYLIKADGTDVARVKMEGTNGQVILAILTVLDWNVTEVTPIFSMDTHDYTITVPDNYSVTVNGTPLSDAYLSGETESVDIFQYAREYADLHDMKKYVITGVMSDISVAVYDGDGNQVECNVNGYDYSAGYQSMGEIPEDYKEMALTMAETWSLLMTRDLSGTSNGFYTLAEYLIEGSYYYKMAYDWATGIDITFTSAHTLGNPIFTNIVVDDYVKYTDNCFSCHIYFDKDMYLTRTGETAYDTTDSTFIFVYYDDSDDSVDNPHWAIADMIANTSN